MKLKTISVTIQHSIAVAKFETIKPGVHISADLEEGDNAEECCKELHKQLAPIWARQALIELGWVAKRRSQSEKHEFAQITGTTRQQVKGMI